MRAFAALAVVAECLARCGWSVAKAPAPTGDRRDHGSGKVEIATGVFAACGVRLGRSRAADGCRAFALRTFGRCSRRADPRLCRTEGDGVPKAISRPLGWPLRNAPRWLVFATFRARSDRAEAALASGREQRIAMGGKAANALIGFTCGRSGWGSPPDLKACPFAACATHADQALVPAACSWLWQRRTGRASSAAMAGAGPSRRRRHGVEKGAIEALPAVAGLAAVGEVSLKQVTACRRRPPEERPLVRGVRRATTRPILRGAWWPEGLRCLAVL